MNKNAIKKFAIDARNKLIASVTDKAGMLGITKDACSEPITKGVDFEVYKTTAETEVTLDKKQCEHRRKLVEQIKLRGFGAVIEEVAYTWFNRICAIRFMEVNDYMYPARVRVLSSEKAGKNEPDILTLAPDIDWDFTDEEREYIIDAKVNNKLDDLFRMLFIKQCNLLHEVLPGLFEETEDYTEMLLNISFTNEDDVIRMLVDGIDEKDFNISTVDENGKRAGQVEIIGWLYQYYNTEPKNKAFAKKGKITKEEVPAVTQLFTPDWIVRYMVENSLGRLWVEGYPDADLQGKWKYYLEEAEQEPQVQAELTKIREEYAVLKPEDIKLIDPCMGSGHILVYAFDVFMQIYENAGWSAREAAQSIVEHNIYGLDIDDRAAQLSYFAVMMKARQYDRRIFTRGVRPNVYAIQESNGINRNQLKYFGAELDEMERNTAILQIEGLLDTLVDAKEYGSILNVDAYDWDLLRRFVNSIDVDGQISFDTYGLDETAEKLKELIEIGAIMAQKYQVVATNPPYAGTSNLSIKVNDFVKKNYPDSKADLFAVFIERCRKMLKKNGYQAMITMHSWMFLSSFEKLREKLQNVSIVNMAHLGARAFDEIGGEVVQTTSFIMQMNSVEDYKGTYCRLVDANSQKEKERLYLSEQKRYNTKQSSFAKIPGNPIAYWLDEAIYNIFSSSLVGEYLDCRSGIMTGSDSYIKLWFEPRITNIKFDCNSAEEMGEYTIFLNDDERAAFELEERIANRKGVKNNREFPRFSHQDEAVREFLWHKRSLYPNNYLHLLEYKKLNLNEEADKYHDVIYSAKNEQEIQQYIKLNHKWFIPGSIFLDYNFGHHDAYLFPEQKLGNEYVADYMLLGKSSDGYSIVLVEFEKANTSYCLSSENMESESVRKGLTQIKDWQRWMSKNQDYFLRNIGLTQKGIDIPIYRIYYYLVVSRRDYMDDLAHDIRSQTMYDMHNVKIVTFDRLEDNIRKLIMHHSW